MLPLYEAKMLHLFDTRWATYEHDGSTRLLSNDEKARNFSPIPRYWVSQDEVEKKLTGRWDTNSFLGWREICRATDSRTVIATRVPRLAYGNKWMLALPSRGIAELQGTWSSFVFDFVARQKLGGTSMSFSTFMQLPMPCPSQLSSLSTNLDRHVTSWFELRVDRLNGWIADEAERAQVRAELDALTFHLYGLPRDEVSYVMDTFPIVKRKDEAAFGTYRTKELILATYDAMAEAKASGRVYQAPWNQEGAR